MAARRHRVAQRSGVGRAAAVPRLEGGLLLQGLHPRSVELLDQRGLLDRFLPHGRAVPGWRFAQLPTRLDFTGLDSRHGYTLFLAQAQTEALLAERARELGAEILRGYETVGLSQDSEGVAVDVRGPGGVDTVRALYAVGCDGGRSIVRQAAGIDFPGTDETLTGMLGDFAVVGAPPAALEAAQDGGVLIAPLEGGLTRFVLMDPERMRVPAGEPVPPEEFRASLVRICGSDLGVADPRWLSRFGNATRLAESYRSGRVLLAGDAAHIHFPAAGQGLNTGLQDAMNLGWRLAAVVNGWARTGLLDGYDEERRPVGRAVTENTEVQTLLAELTLIPQYRRPGAALRRLLDELLGMAEVNRRLTAQVSALGTVYPPAAPGADPLVGRRMPDIGLTTTGSDATRVYDLLPDGRFVHLDLAGDPDLHEAVPPNWGSHVKAVTATEHDDHPALDGVAEVLVRPDGHIAWATRTTDLAARRDERHAALAEWAGTAAAGGAPRHPGTSVLRASGLG
ncbi:FAD-dependent monooxygenase [Streptomyces sp. NPDC059008]|uniref:FAD-dependent monooxygenase n=1 Tax=Streptomyces sp. NPDC059008 TaxID=3346693 RepID=UPI0036C49082